MKRTIVNLLDISAEKYPDFKYLYDKTDNGWQGITFKQLNSHTDIMAAALLEHDFSPGDKLAILSEGRSQWVEAEIAVLKIKATAVPLSVKLLPEELSFRINHSESKAIFTSRNNLEKVLKSIQYIDNPDFKIIYFDKQEEYLDKLLEKYSVSKEKILYYQELKEDGEKAYQNRATELNEIKDKIDEEDVVTISYTSGTTGDPKGIMLTHKNYWHNTHQAQKHFSGSLPVFGKNLIILPVDHSFAHTAGIYAGMLLPFALYFLDARGGALQALKNIPINLQEVQPDIIFTVPALSGNFMNKILEGIRKQGGFVEWLFNLGLNAGIKKNGNGYNKPFFLWRWILAIPHGLADILIFKKVRASLGNFGYAIGGGALLDIAQQRFFASIGLPIYQGYGLTEATPIISANTPVVHKFGSSGMPMPMMDIKIMRDGKELAQGEKGEIVIRGDNVMKGYYKNPEATNKTIIDGWLYTGDMGYIDDDGFLVVTGREKALLIGEDGEKYSPEEIEETIASTSPFVQQIMLYNDHSKFTTAIITLDESYTKDFIKKQNINSAQELLEHIEKSLLAFTKDKELKDKFPKRWLPSQFRIAPEPFTEQNKMLNSTMKMVRFRITEAYKGLIDQMYEPGAKNACDHNIEVLNNLFFK